MANFALIESQLEGVLANQINGGRSTQGMWEWFNALKRIMSANRFSGTPAIWHGTIPDAADQNIGTTSGRLFGVLVDNSNSAEAVNVEIADVADADGGDDLLSALIYVPSASQRYHIFPEPYVFTTDLSFIAGTGTRAGLEAGTAVTGTNPTGVLVYTTG